MRGIRADEGTEEAGHFGWRQEGECRWLGGRTLCGGIRRPEGGEAEGPGFSCSAVTTV